MIFPFSDNVPSTRRPFVTYGLILANLLALGWLVSLPDEEQALATYQWGFVPARVGQLVTGRPMSVEIRWAQRPPGGGKPIPHQVNVELPPQPRQIFISLVSCMFLHAGMLHLLGNMWLLWIFGDNVEDRLGHVTYLGFYLLGGLAATTCHWWADPGSTHPVIGASGAVAAVLGAYFVTWPFARVRALVFLLVFITLIELPALVVLGIWFLSQIVEATSIDPNRVQADVAWWAHIGGFVAGMLLMIALKENRPSNEPPQPGTIESVFRRRPPPETDQHWY